MLDDNGPPKASSEASVRVRGEGVVEVIPDAARISVGIFASRANLKKARQEAASSATGIVAAIKALGIPSRDMQTSRFSIYPRTDRDAKGKETMLGYDVRNTVTITVRDLDQLPVVLDAAVEASANQVTGPVFFIQHPEEAEGEARRLAMASARRRAEVLAREAGATLGRVRSIADYESGSRGTFRNMRVMASVAERSIPIEAGTETVAAEVEVVWELV